jgi:hypothetical protein
MSWDESYLPAFAINSFQMYDKFMLLIQQNYDDVMTIFRY